MLDGVWVIDAVLVARIYLRDGSRNERNLDD
jgi:hypothetical protein